MKPTIAEVLAGAWPAYVMPPKPTRKELIWEATTDFLASWGYPQGFFFTLQETEPAFVGELVLVRLDYDGAPSRWEAGCWFGESKNPYLVQPGKIITFAPTATYRVMGCLVPLEQYKRCPTETRKACRR